MAQNDRVFDWDILPPKLANHETAADLDEMGLLLDFDNEGANAPAVFSGELGCGAVPDEPPSVDEILAEPAPSTVQLPSGFRALFSPNLTAIGLGMVLVFFLWQIAVVVGPVIAHGLASIIAAFMAGAAFFVGLLVKALAILAVAFIGGGIISSVIWPDNGNGKRPGTLPPEFVRRHPTRSGNITNNVIVQVNMNTGQSAAALESTQIQSPI